MSTLDSSHRLGDTVLRVVVQRARSGDPDAWEALYRHARPQLVSYARRRLSSDQAAEDAVSDTLLRAMERIQNFTWEGAGFNAWLYGILRNVVLENYRSDDRTQRLRVKQTAEIDLRERDTAETVWQPLEATAEQSDLWLAFGSLNPADQELLELRIVGELTADQTADVLGRSPGAVRTAQSRALQRLRTAMKERNRAP